MAAPSRERAFLKAAVDGDLLLLQSLASELGNGEGLTKGSLEMVNDGKGRNALHLAAAAGTTHVCKFLVETLKFDVESREIGGNTPLLVAILSHEHPTAVYLIENGAASLDCANLWGCTALYYVAEIGQQEIMSLLLSKGAKAGHDLTKTPYSPLQRACSQRQKECVKLLLDNGADPNSFTKISSSPLMTSIAAKSYECVKLLLEAGADPNLGLLGKTPLIVAATYGDTEIIKRLLKAGANANVVDQTLLITPLEMAALNGNVTAVKALFPFTCRISSIPDWSVDGIMKHGGSKEAAEQLGKRMKNDFLLSKAKGREAFERKDYEDAVYWYCKATCMDPNDAAVLANLSLCSVKLNQAERAVKDAKHCVVLKPDWAKAHYRMGAAWMLVKEYSKALEAFSQALRLDPNNMDIKKAHREAMEAVVAEDFAVLSL